MDAQKIISHVLNYQQIGNESLVEIGELKKKYPWFATLHALEAKCLKNENKFGLKKSIKTASLFAGDREVLYDFIHDGIDVGQKVSDNIIKTTVTDPTPEVVDKKKEVTPTKIEAHQKEEATEVITADKPEVVEATKTGAEISPITPKTEPEKTKVNPEEKLPEIKKRPKTTPPTIVYDPLVELQSKVLDDDKLPKTIKPIKVYDPLVELPKLEAKQQETAKNKQDFFSWLDSLDEEEEVPAPKPRKLKMSAEASQLLENFIKNRPNISRIRTDVDRTEVHKSNPESTGFELVTESLANLHLKQGRPEKAIEIYEKLGLQNPQKFSYFAALIEKTKQEHNLE